MNFSSEGKVQTQPCLGLALLDLMICHCKNCASLSCGCCHQCKTLAHMFTVAAKLPVEVDWSGWGQEQEGGGIWQQLCTLDPNFPTGPGQPLPPEFRLMPVKDTLGTRKPTEAAHGEVVVEIVTAPWLSGLLLTHSTQHVLCQQAHGIWLLGASLSISLCLPCNVSVFISFSLRVITLMTNTGQSLYN